jgi:hypothetical protein
LAELLVEPSDTRSDSRHVPNLFRRLDEFGAEVVE